VQKDTNVFCASLDASKAFDKVLHHGLFVKLIKRCSICTYTFAASQQSSVEL